MQWSGKRVRRGFIWQCGCAHPAMQARGPLEAGGWRQTYQRASPGTAYGQHKRGELAAGGGRLAGAAIVLRRAGRRVMERGLRSTGYSVCVQRDYCRWGALGERWRGHSGTVARLLGAQLRLHRPHGGGWQAATGAMPRQRIYRWCIAGRRAAHVHGSRVPRKEDGRVK
jgi:hypothetical protein